MSDTSTGLASNTCSFEAFLHEWHHKRDQLLTEIKAADKNGDDEATMELIGRALAHFDEYYAQKSRAAQHNVFSLFSPSLCCPLQCAFMWITGFRPGVLLQLVFNSVHNLTTDQIEAIRRLEKEVKKEEKRIADELAKIHEETAAPPLIHGLMNAARWSTDDQPFKPTTNEPLNKLQAALEEVVANADTLRVTTAANVSAILIPNQGLRFLEAAFRLQQGMRKLQIKRNNN